MAPVNFLCGAKGERCGMEHQPRCRQQPPPPLPPPPPLACCVSTTTVPPPTVRLAAQSWVRMRVTCEAQQSNPKATVKATTSRAAALEAWQPGELWAARQDGAAAHRGRPNLEYTNTACSAYRSAGTRLRNAAAALAVGQHNVVPLLVALAAALHIVLQHLEHHLWEESGGEGGVGWGGVG